MTTPSAERTVSGNPVKRTARGTALTDVGHDEIIGVDLREDLLVAGREGFHAEPDAAQQDFVGVVLDAAVVEEGIAVLVALVGRRLLRVALVVAGVVGHGVDSG